MDVAKNFIDAILATTVEIKVWAKDEIATAEGRLSLFKEKAVDIESGFTWEDLEEFGLAQQQFGEAHGALSASKKVIQAIHDAIS